jgi:hypothetical protein
MPTAHPNCPKAARTERSYSGHARLLVELGEPIGYTALIREIPSPYRYSPAWTVYHYKGRPVVLAETAHRCFQLFYIAEDAITDEATATDRTVAQSREG